MGAYTYFLTVADEPPDKFQIGISANSALPAIKDALRKSSNLRYSPILPAYLIPGENPTGPPNPIRSVALFFSPHPYQALGRIKPGLRESERQAVFFTQGLASILLFNADFERASALKAEISCAHLEFWTISDGLLARDGIRYLQDPSAPADPFVLDIDSTGHPELDVYVEQISASICTLWSFYSVHLPSECNTLRRIFEFVRRIVHQRLSLASETPSLAVLRRQNAIASALVELSAALSYSVTQGASGVSPVLDNRSPFPHHSLLGIGGAVRALTTFTRYIESAFNLRSAAEVIKKQYSAKTAYFPAKISIYNSGPAYSLAPLANSVEEFDSGGAFQELDHVPLLAHFSLRHGFKETKFAITAASESLSAECLPPWTLMTLSHELMHSRVRAIFWALFGATWDDDPDAQWDTFHGQFADWYHTVESVDRPILEGLRNTVLNFCCAIGREEPVSHRRTDDERRLDRDDVLNCFKKHKRLAVELFVHFHDYYFAYAVQPKLYVMSLWASWITVAAPIARPLEYLVRTLATIAVGTGAGPRAAFDGAIEILEDALSTLETAGIQSAVFHELRGLVDPGSQYELTFAHFKPAYYLLDQVRKYFASPTIANRIDRLDSDPFSEGSTEASNYSASIYAYGDDDSGSISPIRYFLGALIQQLSGTPALGDPQWLTAWNSMVLGSQEIVSC